MRKACSKCGELTDSFGRSGRSKDGYRSQCKPCERRYDKNRVRDWAAERAAKSQEERRDSHYRHRYCISLEEYDWMLEAQGGVCAICNSDDPQGKGRFCVDHDHETKEIRGLLCHPCNVSLGQLKDSPEILRAAARYLEDHGL